MFPKKHIILLEKEKKTDDRTFPSVYNCKEKITKIIKEQQQKNTANIIINIDVIR